MKKALLVISAIVVVLVVLWFRAAKVAVTNSVAEPWPGGMGTLDSALDRYPPLHANDTSRKLTQLINAVPKSQAVGDFVAREMARGELTIADSPPLPDISEIRELLLREPIVWESQNGIGNTDTETMRVVHLTVARTLVGNALAKAAAKDPTSWDDLHAARKLMAGLEGHPQMMAQTAAFTTARMINAVAWKMPVPAPEWFDELNASDNLRPILESFQYQSASYWESTATFPTKWLAASVDHDRQIAEELFNNTGCEVTARMNELGTDLTSVWRRVFLDRAEREATANALRLRQGKSIESASRCSDRSWIFDGSTLRLSRDIAIPVSEKAMPLALRLKP